MLEKAHEVVSFLEKPHAFNAMNDLASVSASSSASAGGDGNGDDSGAQPSSAASAGVFSPQCIAQIVRALHCTALHCTPTYLTPEHRR